MTGLDYLVLLMYVAGVFVIGGIFGGKIKNSRDMFAAGGQSPWWVSGLSSFMTMFSAGTFVVWGGIAYKHGMVGISINLCNGIAAMLAGYLVAGRWKRIGVTTGAKFVELRFGRVALQFYTWTGIVYKMLAIGVALYSVAVLLSALVPVPEGYFFRDPVTGHLAVSWALLLFGCIVVIYTVVGGLWAVLMTDVLQFIVLSLAVAIVIPLIIVHERIGGFTGFIERAPEGFLSPTAGEFTWFFLCCWVAIQFFSIGGEWGFAQRFICVSSERDAKRSAWLFGALYLVSPFIWMLPPMMYRLVNPDADPKEAYILACREVLPPGVVGLMLAAMFSATASMIDSQLNVFSGVLTRDFYRPLLKPDSSERHLVLVGRIMTTVLGLILIGVALSVPNLGGVENVVLSVGGLMMVPLLSPTVFGMLSPRIDTKAVWLTAGTCFIAGITLKFGLNPGGFLSGIALTTPLSRWIQANSRSAEMLVGVVIPVLILVVLVWRIRVTHHGWLRVEEHALSQIALEKPETSELPARMLAWTVGIMGILILALTFLQNRVSPVLYVFGFLLIAIAGGIGWRLTTHRKRYT